MPLLLSGVPLSCVLWIRKIRLQPRRPVLHVDQHVRRARCVEVHAHVLKQIIPKRDVARPLRRRQSSHPTRY